MNGGTCTERCLSPKEKFICQCPRGYIGKLCQTKHITSCMDVLVTSKSFPKDGVYWITRSDKSRRSVPVFCSFEKIPTRAWTLIESFAFANNEEFKYKSFDQDYPVNRDDPPFWKHFRIGFRRMQYIHSKSTLFSATCDFPKRNGLLTPDLLIGRLSDVDIFSSQPIDGCKRFVYIDIKGTNCSDCTAYAVQYPHQHFHIYPASHIAVYYSCDFPFVGHVDSFGYYNVHDDKTKCTASPSSTTQWWLGQEE